MQNGKKNRINFELNINQRHTKPVHDFYDVKRTGSLLLKFLVVKHYENDTFFKKEYLKHILEL